jgi:Radical SAM superfamily
MGAVKRFLQRWYGPVPSKNTGSAAGALAYYEEQRRVYDAVLAEYMIDRFMHSPRVLSIETYVKCNAICEFCPYPTSARIGQKMDIGLIQKIIDDVAASDIHPEHFVPCRISEPMFDRRMYTIFDYAAMKLPKTGIGHFTNGTTLRPKNIDRLSVLPNLGFINVSLNSHQPNEHKRLMGLKFELVLENLRTLHQAFEKRGVTKPVYLTRVGDGTQQDIDFMDWCRSNFPLFTPMCRPRFDWLGKTYAMDTSRIAMGCSQWFSLNFLANGRDALCCIDDDARYGTGDARTENALEIYNHPTRMELRKRKMRSLHPACAMCNAAL